MCGPPPWCFYVHTPGRNEGGGGQAQRDRLRKVNDPRNGMEGHKRAIQSERLYLANFDLRSPKRNEGGKGNGQIKKIKKMIS